MVFALNEIMKFILHNSIRNTMKLSLLMIDHSYCCVINEWNLEKKRIMFVYVMMK